MTEQGKTHLPPPELEFRITAPFPYRELVVRATCILSGHNLSIQDPALQANLGPRDGLVAECLLEGRQNFGKVVQAGYPDARFPEPDIPSDGIPVTDRPTKQNAPLLKLVEPQPADECYDSNYSDENREENVSAQTGENNSSAAEHC